MQLMVLLLRAALSGNRLSRRFYCFWIAEETAGDCLLLVIKVVYQRDTGRDIETDDIFI